jgi:hypothetical protein
MILIRKRRSRQRGLASLRSAALPAPYRCRPATFSSFSPFTCGIPFQDFLRPSSSAPRRQPLSQASVRSAASSSRSHPLSSKICPSALALMIAQRTVRRHWTPSNFAALPSRYQKRPPVLERTSPAGSTCSLLPCSTSPTALAFASPATRKRTALARLMAGSVSVTRECLALGPGTGTGTARRELSSSSEAPGKSEAVCPSAPIPRMTRSKVKGAAPKKLISSRS